MFLPQKWEKTQDLDTANNWPIVNCITLRLGELAWRIHTHTHTGAVITLRYSYLNRNTYWHEIKWSTNYSSLSISNIENFDSKYPADPPGIAWERL